MSLKASPDSRREELDSIMCLMVKWQDHAIEIHVGWEILWWPSLKNAICHMNQLNVSDGGYQGVHDCSCGLILGDQTMGLMLIEAGKLEELLVR